MSRGRRPAAPDPQADLGPSQGPIVLIGPMAAGKSHLAKYMARRYGYGYADSDSLIVQRHGQIPQLFEARGEDEFRRIEAETIAELLEDESLDDSILSLGGGAPMTASVEALLQHQMVAYLEIDERSVRRRLRRAGNRPMLKGDPVQRWRDLMTQRRDTYEALADIRLDASGNRPISRIAEDLHEEIQALRRQAAG